MKAINRFFISVFAVLAIAGAIGIVLYGKTHQLALVAVCLVMIFTLASDKADFEVKEDDQK